MYGLGEGVLRDPAKAFALHKKGCDGGSLGACTSLGLDYVTGVGVTKNPAAGVPLFERACGEGHAAGCDFNPEPFTRA